LWEGLGERRENTKPIVNPSTAEKKQPSLLGGIPLQRKVEDDRRARVKTQPRELTKSDQDRSLRSTLARKETWGSSETVFIKISKETHWIYNHGSPASCSARELSASGKRSPGGGRE